MSNITHIFGKQEEELEEFLQQGRESILEYLKEMIKSVEDGNIDEVVVFTSSNRGDVKANILGSPVNPFVMSYLIKKYSEIYDVTCCDICVTSIPKGDDDVE